MSWLQRLTETYDTCFGQPQFNAAPLTPIDHVEQQAHIEIALDEAGNFLRAAVVNKEPTLIPATEKSAGRTSGAVAHPLCDKLRYVAADFGSSDYALYLQQLTAWAQATGNPALQAILAYVERGTTVADLVHAQVLTRTSSGELETEWKTGTSPLAKLLTADPKTKRRNQGNALIRWRVELPGGRESGVWKDARLQAEWAVFNATLPSTLAFCYSSGNVQPLAANHPKRLRHGGDGAKLISSNDEAGYTFRGRFGEASEAYGLSSAATQKAHNALRWLIARQGSRNADQVVVAWAVSGAKMPPVVSDTLDFAAESAGEEPEPVAYAGDAGQEYAHRLTKAVRGYQARFDDHDQIVIMMLDSATPGRMAILYYRELTGSELLTRLERWHRRLAWPQNFGKERHFIGAPAPRDIAEAAYGRRVDDKLRKATVERLLPCIIDGCPLPRDLMLAAVARATNRIAMERWEFERVLGIACSLVRAVHFKENDTMSLDETRHTREYLYGRLLAIADNLEELALFVARENRETNAARLTQRFADHPFTTWRTLELQLKPYVSRLRGSRAGALQIRERLLDEVMSRFPVVDGESSFTDNRRLSGEFLLGFHSQREALRAKKPGPISAEAGQTELMEAEGDTE